MYNSFDCDKDGDQIMSIDFKQLKDDTLFKSKKKGKSKKSLVTTRLVNEATEQLENSKMQNIVVSIKKHKDKNKKSKKTQITKESISTTSFVKEGTEQTNGISEIQNIIVAIKKPKEKKKQKQKRYKLGNNCTTKNLKLAIHNDLETFGFETLSLTDSKNLDQLYGKELRRNINEFNKIDSALDFALLEEINLEDVPSPIINDKLKHNPTKVLKELKKFCSPPTLDFYMETNDKIIDEGSCLEMSLIPTLQTAFQINHNSHFVKTKKKSNVRSTKKKNKTSVPVSKKEKKSETQIQPVKSDKIEDSNLGHKLLQRMGWTKGNSLGANNDGIKDPIISLRRKTKCGLGSKS